MAFLSLFPLFFTSLAFIFILSLDIKSALFIRSPFKFIDISLFATIFALLFTPIPLFVAISFILFAYIPPKFEVSIDIFVSSLLLDNIFKSLSSLFFPVIMFRLLA